MEPIRVSIAKDFSRFPGGRDASIGPYSGERFRREILIPALIQALEKRTTVLVRLDGVFGFNSSFLEEAFGGLLRDERSPARSKTDIYKLLAVEGKSESIIREIWSYIDQFIETQGQDTEGAK